LVCGAAGHQVLVLLPGKCKKRKLNCKVFNLCRLLQKHVIGSMRIALEGQTDPSKAKQCKDFLSGLEIEFDYGGNKFFLPLLFNK